MSATPVTPVPEPARALADVVHAFESADVAALNAALDAADPELLNRVPQIKDAQFCSATLQDGQLMTRHKFDGPCYKFGEASFFGILTEDFDDYEPSFGQNPLNLIACATFVLTEGRFDQTEWITKHTDDEWVAVYSALVNHPKVDVNAATVYKDFMAQNDQLSTEVRAQHVGDVVFCEIYDDCLAPLDYCLLNLHQRLAALPYDAVQTHASKRWVGVFHALLSTGKVDLEREHHFYQNDAYLSAGVPMGAICFLRLPHVTQTAFDLYDAEVLNPRECLEWCTKGTAGWTAEYKGDYPEQLRQAVKKCISKAARKFILTKFIPLVARVHIFLARWSADVRLKAYAPDGAGAKRAQQSFDATAAAAGW